MKMKNLDLELDRLRSEVANLSTSLNELHSLRLIRIFDRYRMARHRLEEKRARRNKFPAQNRPNHAAPLKNFKQTQPYDVLIFSGANWGFRFQRPQQLARQWALHGYRVFFVSPQFEPAVNPAYLQPPQPFTANLVYPGILEVHLAGPREQKPLSHRMLEADRQDLMRSCRKLQEFYNIHTAVCVLEFPFWTPLALSLRRHLSWKIVYDFMDRYYGIFPGAHAVLAEEIELLRRSNLVVASAKLLVKDAQEYNQNTCYIPNGADNENFSRPAATNPLLVKGIRAPVIGYFGALDRWVDLELVYTVAGRRPEWQFVLIGSGLEDVSQLAALPNVHLLGELPYAQLPDYLAHFDVCIIPFRSLPVTAATNPVKLYEYLAAGKPVVASGLPEIKDLLFVRLAGTPEEFEDAIATGLHQDSPALQQQRREFARQNTWQERFAAYDQAIHELFQPGYTPEPAHPENSIAKPFLIDISPAAIRVNQAFEKSTEDYLALSLAGKDFSPDCLALIDERPLETQFVDQNKITCQVPWAWLRVPGSFMISVIDQKTWQQSQRRIFLVEMI